jgi:hypothetical protein
MLNDPLPLQLACSYYDNHFHNRLWCEVLPDQTKESVTVAVGSSWINLLLLLMMTDIQ